MGYLSTMAVIETGADRQILLRWHLQVNHSPPVSTDWIPCCEWVIERALAGENLDVIAPVPDGYRLLSARQILEELHLGPWVTSTLQPDDLRDVQ